MRLPAITCVASVCWAAALGAQAAPMLSLTPAAIVGDSLAGALAIGRPTAVTVARNGDVIVFGAASRQIRRYAATGAMTQVLDVPAGCQMVAALGFLGDTLWAADGDNRRLLLYPPGRRAPIAIATSVRGPVWGGSWDRRRRRRCWSGAEWFCRATCVRRPRRPRRARRSSA